MKHCAAIRLLTLQSERLIAMVRFCKPNSNVIRLRAIPYSALRHLVVHQGVRL
jgi:hypothetical protein